MYQYFYRFQDEISWAFKIFDIDNSGSIAVHEIHESVKAVWKILDGIGDTIDGTVEDISDFLYQRLVQQGKDEVNNFPRKRILLCVQIFFKGLSLLCKKMNIL